MKHRRRLDQHAGAGQAPLPGAWHRFRQHRQLQFRLKGWCGDHDLKGLGRSGHDVGLGGGSLQPLTDRELRHPQRQADLFQGFPRRPEGDHPGHQLTGHLRRPFRARLARHQPGDPARGVLLPPPPQRHRARPEPGGHIHRGSHLQLDQLHRRQPAARLITGIPGIHQHAVHEHPATLAVLNQNGGRADTHPHDRGHRQRRLSSHDRHHPTPKPE